MQSSWQPRQPSQEISRILSIVIRGMISKLRGTKTSWCLGHSVLSLILALRRYDAAPFVRSFSSDNFWLCLTLENLRKSSVSGEIAEIKYKLLLSFSILPHSWMVTTQNTLWNYLRTQTESTYIHLLNEYSLNLYCLSDLYFLDTYIFSYNIITFSSSSFSNILSPSPPLKSVASFPLTFVVTLMYKCTNTQIQAAESAHCCLYMHEFRSDH